MIKLLLADDHAMFREGLRSKFKDCSDIRLVGEAAGVADLMELIRKARPDVIILDIKLPDGNGLQLIPKIRDVCDHCKIIMLTMYDVSHFAIQALESGAQGYILKGASFEELIRAVRDVVAGQTVLSPEIAAQIGDRMNRIGKSPQKTDLSQRERQTLIQLSDGLTLKEIGANLGISEKSVHTYRTRLLKKLNLNTTVDLIKYALESGLAQTKSG